MSNAPAAGDCLVTGTLTRAAEARTRQLDGEHDVPVLCLELETDTPAHLPVRVEQPFPVGHYTQCAQAARRLRKGVTVTVQTSVLSWRLHAAASHVHIESHNDNPEEP